MVEKTYLKVDEVAELLGVSKSYAYKVVQKLNKQLKDMGYLTIAGRINKKYFEKSSKKKISFEIS